MDLASCTTVMALSKRIHDELAGRTPPKQIQLEGTLLKKSHVPTSKEIAPYRESLAVYEYKVDRVLKGTYEHDRIRVAHRVILDGSPLPLGKLAAEAKQSLTLELFSKNRQLKTTNQSDTLEFDFDLELYFDVRELSAPNEK